MEEPPFILPN
jgi:hypothetical protein